MGQKTSDDYLKAVKFWYQSHRIALHEGVMAEPSNAVFRDLCLAMARNGLSTSDEKVFKDFFKVGQTDDLQKAISRYDIEKFRPLLNFLKGASQTTDPKNLNLIAVLIGFQPRPLSKFLQQPEEKFGPGKEKKESLKPRILQEKDRVFKARTLYWLGAMGLMAVLITLLAINHKPSEGCMFWREDHYIEVSCQDTAFERKLIEPMNLKQFKLRKVPVSKNTVFFINGKQRIWYLKHGNQYDFFDRPGYHPVKDKSLKPITPYIAMKVVDGQIK